MTDETTTPPATPDAIDVVGAAGEPIELPLGAGPATGYVWTLELPDGVVQLQDGPHLPEPMPGKDTSGRFRIQADEPGLYEVSASYARPWEEEIVDTRTFVVTVV